MFDSSGLFFYNKVNVAQLYEGGEHIVTNGKLIPFIGMVVYPQPEVH